MDLIVAGIQATAYGTHTGVASGSDAARMLITTDLASAGVDGDGARRDSFYDHGYLWWPRVPEQRKVAPNGYSPVEVASDVSSLATSTESVATLVTTRRWSSTVPAGDELEIHTRLPVADADRKAGLHTLLNRSLDTLRISKQIIITADTAQQQQFDLSTDPWVTRQSQLSRVYGSTSSLTQLPIQWPGKAELFFDGEKPYLRLDVPAASGQSLHVDFMRRSSSWIRARRTAVASPTYGGATISAVSVLVPGTGYYTTPLVTFTAATGSAPAATAVVASGTVSSIGLTFAGSGLTTAPTVTVAAPTGTWADSTVGLQNELDECVGEQNQIVGVAYYFGCGILANDDPLGENARWQAEQERTAEEYKGFLLHQQPLPARVPSIAAGYRGLDSPEFLRSRDSGRRGGGRRWR